MGNVCISTDKEYYDEYYEEYYEDKYKNLQLKYNILVEKYNNLLDDYTYTFYKNRQITNDYIIMFENYNKNNQTSVDNSDYVILK